MEMKRILSFNGWWLLICLLSFGALAADDTELTNSVTKKFKVGPTVNIDLENKYGQVIISTWQKDSVVVNIEVRAFGKNQSDTRKTLERVDFDFNHVSNFLTIKTVFDRSSGTFKEVMRGIGDYSKSLLSKNKLQIDYEIFIPEKASFDLNNKFGNVYINEHSGSLKVEMSHGDFKANELTGDSRVELSFGNASIKNLQDAELTLRASEVEIEKTANLNLVSSSSKIEIGEAFSLKVDSRNDKLEIGNVQVIQGKGVFSKIRLGTVESLIDLDLSYGDLVSEMILSKFSKVEVEGRSTDIEITVSDRSSFRALLIARDDNFELDEPLSAFARSKHDNRKGYTVVTGDYGAGNPSELTIKAQGGDVSVQMREENLSTLKRR